ncbi:hypothetical protein MLD38_036051 [Melastoma candidum]|uniref:Uncharacterized protein n=1 Tax=Melastoma candidum TaxID=119954 RepID=A0ACB9LID1_9MYRT|nr:hypothetical protein MLD38_036051 [Melastoma candidum]
MTDEEDDDLCPVDCVREFKTDEELFNILDKAKENNSLVVVDFYRTSCGSCKYIEQGFSKLCKVAGDEQAGVIFLKHNDNSPSDSSCDEAEISNPPGRLIFEYLERDQPYSREPLADKIAALASKFPDLRTCRSCDVTPSSWISVAWFVYPIYRIPIGPTLQNLDACFLTFHSLSTSALTCDGFEMLYDTGKPADVLQSHHSSLMGIYGGDTSPKLSLPVFGLASCKFKISVWNPSGVEECPKAISLLRVADNWLRLLQVNHPDFIFFVSHSSYWSVAEPVLPELGLGDGDGGVMKNGGSGGEGDGGAVVGRRESDGAGDGGYGEGL